MYVAYNDYGDLVASAYTYERLLDLAHYAGYEPDELFIGRITP